MKIFCLCEAFIDVTLNADKFKTAKGTIAGRFRLEDMINAPKLAKDYLTNTV